MSKTYVSKRVQVPHKLNSLVYTYSKPIAFKVITQGKKNLQFESSNILIHFTHFSENYVKILSLGN